MMILSPTGAMDIYGLAHALSAVLREVIETLSVGRLILTRTVTVKFMRRHKTTIEAFFERRQNPRQAIIIA